MPASYARSMNHPVRPRKIPREFFDRFKSLAALVAMLSFSMFSGSAGPMLTPDGLTKTLDIGAAAPDFDLPGVDGARHSLKDYADAKILMIVFTANHCKTA